MKPDEDNEVWNLLGKASQRNASPYFVRKVLREIRMEKLQPRFSIWALLRWLAPVSACAAIALGWTVHQRHEEEVAKFNEAFDNAADLQSLVAYQDVSDLVDPQQ